MVTHAATGQYKWDGGPSHCIVILKSASLLKVVDKVREKIPAGRTVRANYGAVENPAAGTVIPHATSLQSDEEVEPFFDLPSCKPIGLQVVLHRDPNQVLQIPDSPSPNDGPYFAVDFLDVAEVYQDPPEDPDVLQRNCTHVTYRVCSSVTSIQDTVFCYSCDLNKNSVLWSALL